MEIIKIDELTQRENVIDLSEFFGDAPNKEEKEKLSSMAIVFTGDEQEELNTNPEYFKRTAARIISSEDDERNFLNLTLKMAWDGGYKGTGGLAVVPSVSSGDSRGYGYSRTGRKLSNDEIAKGRWF